MILKKEQVGSLQTLLGGDKMLKDHSNYNSNFSHGKEQQFHSSLFKNQGNIPLIEESSLKFNVNQILNHKTFVSSIISSHNLQNLNVTKSKQDNNDTTLSFNPQTSRFIDKTYQKNANVQEIKMNKKLNNSKQLPQYKSKIVLKQKGSKNILKQFELLIDGFLKSDHWFTGGQETQNLAVKSLINFEENLGIFLQNIEDFFVIQKDKIAHDDKQANSLEKKIQALEEELKAYRVQDYDTGKVKSVPLSKYRERKEAFDRTLQDHEKIISQRNQKIVLLELKCERLQQIINETEQKGSSYEQNVNQLLENIEELNDQMVNMQETAEVEFKNKDKLLIKMYEERTKNLNKVKQYKELLELKEERLGEFNKREKDMIEKNNQLQKQIESLNQNAEQRNIYIQELKNQINSSSQINREKAQKMDELTTKLQDLERAIRSGKFSKQNLDPIHFQVSLEGFMFKLFNDDPYALSNNIRLGLQLGNKNIHISNAGLERRVLVENSLPDTGGERDQLGNFQIIDINQVNLLKFQYAKPKLALLIDHVFNTKATLVFEPPYEQWLFMTIRGILDSKYQEMVMHEDSLTFHQASKFVDFVYSWLGNFSVDKTSKMVRSLEFFEKDKADNLRLQLLLGLQASQNLNENLWEYNAFVEFLEDKLQIDEQCYYLHCRNLLFRGPHLKDTGSHQRMHLIDLEKANEFVDYLFEKMPQEDAIKLKARLKSLSRRAPIFKSEDEELDLADIFGNAGSSKNKKQVVDFWQIDQGLLLRILLEYYRREKKIRVLLLKRLFEEEPKDSFSTKGNLSFFAFRKIIEQFDPSMLDIEIARVYREAFVAGNGIVNFDSIILVFNEQCFFIRTLQVKGRNEAPSVNHLNDIALPDGLTEEQLARIPEEKIRDTELNAFIYEHWRNNEYNFLTIRRLIENSGQEGLLNKFITLENYIKNKGQIDQAKVRGRSMMQVYRRLFKLILKFRCYFLEIHQDDFSAFSSNQTKSLKHFKQELAFFEGFIDQDHEMTINISRFPKGKDISDEKKYWIQMQNLFINGHHIQREVTLRKQATFKKGSLMAPLAQDDQEPTLSNILYSPKRLMERL
eukprot:403356947